MAQDMNTQKIEEMGGAIQPPAGDWTAWKEKKTPVINSAIFLFVFWAATLNKDAQRTFLPMANIKRCHPPIIASNQQHTPVMIIYIMKLINKQRCFASELSRNGGELFCTYQNANGSGSAASNAIS